MSRTKKSAKGRESKTSYRRVLRPSYLQQQPGLQAPKRNRAIAFATFFAAAIAIAALLGITLLFYIGHGYTIAFASIHATSPGNPTSYGSLNHAKGPCGNAGQIPCSPVNPGWFSVSSESPTAVAAVIAHSTDYVSMQSHFGYVSLDMPVLVHAYGAKTGIEYYDNDHWVVSVRNAAGVRCGIFDFVYDRSHHAMRYSSYGVITPVDPHARQAFPYTAAPLASAALKSHRGLNVKGGTQPELIFFPIDPNFPVLTSPAHKWSGGGNSPMNPMWLLTGADGQDYFIGADLAVHVTKDLPIAQGRP
jgi:hypothetical protein